MSVTVGTYGATNSTGWSTFTAPSTGNIYYVAANGSDSNTGLTVGDPVLTTKKAYHLAAAAGNGRDHYILMRKGDTFTDQMLGPYSTTVSPIDIDGHCALYGASATNPLVWGSYDPAFPGVVNPTTGGARPIIETPHGRCGFINIGGTPTSGGDYMAIVGLKLISYTNDPDDSRFSVSVATSSTIGSGGSGYVNNEIVTLIAADGTTVEVGKVKIIVSGGAVTGFFDTNNTGPTQFAYAGLYDYYDRPTSFTTTGGSGSGFTITGPVYTASGASGIAFGNPFNWALVEDCDVRYFTTQGFAGSIPDIQKSGTFYMRRNTWAYNYANGIDSGAIDPWYIEENVFWHNGHIAGITNATSFIHNAYVTDLARKGDPTTATNAIIRGNIFGHGPSGNQFRNGFQVYDNCFIKEATSHNWGNVTNRASALYNNVYLEGLTLSPPNEQQGTCVMEFATRMYGDGYAVNTGSASITGNIAASSIQSTGQGFDISPGANNATVSNNIVYKWCPSSTPPNNTIKSYSGVCYSFAITDPGSGYTDRPITINSIRRESKASGDQFNSNMIILQVTSTVDMNCGPHDSGCGSLYLGTISGTGALPAALSNKIWICAIRNTTRTPGEVVLYCPADDQAATSDLVTGTFSSGTCYIPYSNVSLINVSGSGSGAVSDIHVAGGSVVGFYLGGSTGDWLFNAGGSGGTGYTASDVLRNNTLDARSLNLGSTSLRCTPSLCSVTVDATNKTDPTGTNPYGWPDPGRTSGSYYTSIGSPGGYSADADGFLQAASENNKTSWNTALTAKNGIVPYIQAGFFGISGGSGGAAPSQGNQSGKVKGPRLKMPHVFTAVEDFIAKTWKALSGLWRFQQIQQPAERS